MVGRAGRLPCSLSSLRQPNPEAIGRNRFEASTSDTDKTPRLVVERSNPIMLDGDVGIRQQEVVCEDREAMLCIFQE